VYALDLPGHGQSGGASESTLSGYAEQILDWLRELALPAAVLMGHSMGGAIALTIALRAPRRLAGMVLAGSSARLRVAPAILRDSAQRGSFPQAVDRVIGAAFSSNTSDRLVELARERMLESGHLAFHNDFQACDHFDVRARLEEIDLPALVISGEEDQLTPPKLGRELAEGLPGGTFQSVPAAGHMVMLEQPEVVLQALAAFYLDHFSADG
jgi:pimeloyl-ACP methyl ester carboxylesterase